MAVRTILIPLDESDLSRHIVRVVRTYICPDDVQLVLIRAIPPPADHIGAGQTEASSDSKAGDDSTAASAGAPDAALDSAAHQYVVERQRVRTMLASEVEHLRRSGYSVRAEVQTGETAQCIIDYATSNQVDLVAVPTDALSGPRSLVLGAVAERLVRGVSAPVLLMRGSRIGTEGTAAD